MSAEKNKRVIVKKPDGTRQEIPLDNIPPGEEFIYLSNCPYYWQGEEMITYEEKRGLHFVNGKVYGFDSDKAKMEEIPHPDQITSASMGGQHLLYLSKFPNLLALSTHDTNLTHLEHLGNVPNLRVLDLGLNTDLTDEGLFWVAGLVDLRWLNLIKTPISDAGLVHLSGLKKLSILWLADTSVTGKGLDALAELKNLKMLGLTNTGVSDEDLGRLSSLSSLENLNVKGTMVTQNGVEQLKQAIPGCEIEFSDSSASS